LIEKSRAFYFLVAAHNHSAFAPLAFTIGSYFLSSL
jgi:hypothetical protein